MKKIFTLLTLLLTTVAAMATDFTDKMTAQIQGRPDINTTENAKLTVTDKGDGKFDVTFNDVYVKQDNYTDNYGTFTFADLEGTTANGLTTISGKLVDGTITGSTVGLTTIGSTDVTVKIKGDKAYASFSGIIHGTWRDMTLNATFGDDDFPAEAVVVGTDNYAPAGEAFDWEFNIDFKTQKLSAVIDLSTCNANNTNENVCSIGTDINNWFSGVAMGGNIHIYYTPSTKTLNCWYISSNETLGAWKYNSKLENIEGEINIDFSRQLGLRINGKQVYEPALLIKLLNQTALHIGSKEGTTRSNATYKQVRVVDATYEPTEAVEYTQKAKLGFNGAYDRSDNAKAEVKQTGIDEYSLTFKQLTVGGNVLGDITFSGLKGSLVEGDQGDNTPGYVLFHGKNLKVKATNLTAAATSLGLVEGMEIDADTLYAYTSGTTLYAETTLSLWNNKATYNYGIEAPTPRVFTQPLSVNYAQEEGTYTDKELSFADYSDGYADITLKSMMFPTNNAEVGDLTIKEVPYTKVNGDLVFDVKDLKASIAITNDDYELIKDWTNVTVKGSISGELINLTITGGVAGMTILLNYGEEIPEAKVYTDKMEIENGSENSTVENQTIAIRDNGEGNYTINIPNVCGETVISFPATGTTDDNGVTTYTTEDEVQAPLHQVGWEGYYAYVTISDAKSIGDKLYASIYIDLGHYASYGYSDYGYFLTFGDEETVGINGAQTAVRHDVKDIYSVNGMRLNRMQKGVNIVRTTDGKTFKVIK